MWFKNWLENEDRLRLFNNPKFEKNKRRLENLPVYLYFVTNDPGAALEYGLGGPGFSCPNHGHVDDCGVDLMVRPQGKGSIFRIKTEDLDLDLLDFNGENYIYKNEIPSCSIELLR